MGTALRLQYSTVLVTPVRTSEFQPWPPVAPLPPSFHGEHDCIAASTHLFRARLPFSAAQRGKPLQP